MEITFVRILPLSLKKPTNLPASTCLISSRNHHRHRHRHRVGVTAVVQSSKNKNGIEADVSIDRRSEIEDGPFGKMFISLFRKIMAPKIGWKSSRDGYDGMIEEMRMLLATKSPRDQQKVVFHTLNTIFQAPYGPQFYRNFLSDKYEQSAAITPKLFSWLVGPCSANITQDGYHGVHVEKCRFLDESGCKGLCVNMCQQPTQTYFAEVLGLPLRMTPDYDDNSCQMTFGLHALPISEDPAVTGNCFINCKMSGSYKSRGEDNCYVSEEAEPSEKN